MHTSTSENISDAGTPLYVHVADRLREEIQSGRIHPGERMSGEVQLASELGVSRLTIRSALAVLRREGFVVTRHGLGSFAHVLRLRQILARLELLDETIAEQGLRSVTRILDYRFGTPPEEARAGLVLPPHVDALIVRRLHSVQGEPIAFVELCVPAEIGAHFSLHDVEEHTFYELVSTRLGLAIGRAAQSIRAEAASETVARALHVGEGAPLLVCERVTFSDQDRPIVYALFNYRADRFEFRIGLSGHEWKVPWAAPGLSSLRVVH